MSVLSAEHIVVRAGAAVLLADVSVSVELGQVHALLGPNGAGKSTLLGVLAGDRRPARGSVQLHDRDLRQWRVGELARARAVFTQEHDVAFGFTAREVVALGRGPWSGTEQADRDDERIAAALHATDLDGHADQIVSTLSGGERARVALARVLAQDTDVLLWDEPTAALDLRHQEDVLHLARTLAHDELRPRAVVVVVHDLNLAAAYADHVTLLDGGQLVAMGTPAEVLTAERISAVYRQPVDVWPHPHTGAPLIVPVR